MSLVTATAAQRTALRNTATNLSEQAQVYAQSAAAPTTAEAAIVQPYIDAAKTAIDAVNGTTGATVANGATVAVRNSASTDSHNGTAVVAGSTLTGVNLLPSIALVDNGDLCPIVGVGSGTTLAISPVTVVTTEGSLTSVSLVASATVTTNNATVPLAQSGSTSTVATGTATVVNNAVSRVSAPATAFIVPSGFALTGVTPSGTYTNTVTFTVAGGAITAIVLS